MDEELATLTKSITGKWANFMHLWTRMGYQPDQVSKRKKVVIDEMMKLITEMEEEEQVRVDTKQSNIEDLKNEIAKLLKDLTMDNDEIGHAMSYAKEAKGKSLIQIEDLFNKLVADLRKRKAIRMEKYEGIQNAVNKLSSELDEEPMTIDFDGIPSDSQVSKLESHLHHLQREKTRRQALFTKLRKSVHTLFGYVERIPKNEFERVCSADRDPSGDSNIKILSLKVLKEMEEMEESLKNQITAHYARGEDLWNKIRELWSRLAVDEEIRLAFENVHKGAPSKYEVRLIYRPTVLKALAKELARLEQEKLANMALFINQVRDELMDLWTIQCFMEKVDDRFQHPNYYKLTNFTEADLHSDTYTEELLTKHEVELEFWKSFVARNKKIVDGITKRGHMFNQLREMEQKSDDPARLANRGGALLKEEKERKRLEKAIPKLEAELKALSIKFEEDRDAGFGMRKFIVFGKDIVELIESDWQQLHDEKERRKESRKKPEVPTYGGRTMMTTQLGPAGSRKRPLTPSSAQRNGPFFPTPVKRNKMAPATPGRTIYTPQPQAGSVNPSNTTSRIGKPPTGKLTRAGANGKSANGVGSDGDNNFLRPATRSKKIPQPPSEWKGSGRKSKTGEKEQVDPTTEADLNPATSPVVSTYTEFTGHLLGQSTLNSSTVSTVMKNPPPPSTPTRFTRRSTRSNDNAKGTTFTPAKGHFPDGEYF